MTLYLKLNPIVITILLFLTLFILPRALYAEKESKTNAAFYKTLRHEIEEIQKELAKISKIYQKISELVGPSVVKIKMKNEMEVAESKENKGGLSPTHQPETLPEYLNKKEFNLYSTFELPDKDVGSGFIVDKSGLIITAYHVIKKFKEKSIEVTLHDKTRYKGEVVRFDPRTDLALLKIKGAAFKPVEFENNVETQRGDIVVAMGYPYGKQQTISTGIITFAGQRYTESTFPSTLSYNDFMQTDAAINPGSSGGPLINMRGKVVGLNAAITTRRGGFNGIGYAIPAAIVGKAVKDLAENGKNNIKKQKQKNMPYVD